MNQNIMRLLKNLQVLIDNDSMGVVFKIIATGNSMLNNLDEFNNLIEKELSYWKEVSITNDEVVKSLGEIITDRMGFGEGTDIECILRHDIKILEKRIAALERLVQAQQVSINVSRIEDIRNKPSSGNSCGSLA